MASLCRAQAYRSKQEQEGELGVGEQRLPETWAHSNQRRQLIHVRNVVHLSAPQASHTSRDLC